MKIPFLFAVRAHDGDDFAGQNPIVKWVVMLADWAYSTYNARWMCDSTVGNLPLVPSVDLVNDDSIWVFTTEVAALEKMRELWSAVKLPSELESVAR